MSMFEGLLWSSMQLTYKCDVETFLLKTHIRECLYVLKHVWTAFVFSVVQSAFHRVLFLSTILRCFTYVIPFCANLNIYVTHFTGKCGTLYLHFIYLTAGEIKIYLYIYFNINVYITLLYMLHYMHQLHFKHTHICNNRIQHSFSGHSGTSMVIFDTSSKVFSFNMIENVTLN